ncbi:MAG: threonine ammonia-lyase [Actinobacteria bacterium]|uniref:threonine ammonia-lyase n=1 Tax=freshwater metagenome TaxID=449393 RepID=A0A6J7QH82_9ZZZZ|nr:threonine ammonia-lyase [Actinomycetota bacterium]
MVTADDVIAARPVVAELARATPVRSARWLADRVGGPVWIKCENMQRAGSFKVRGAYLRLSRMTPEERARGVVTASAGNHAQGMAVSAQALGVPATVFMPHGAPLPKVRATRGYGAEVRFSGSTIDEAMVAAREFSDATGAVLVHPFDHPDIVTGQGTIALEILEQVPDVRTVVVCTGGGGLLAGIVAVMRDLAPHVRVVGVQAEGAAAYPPSLAAGHPVPLASMSTMADGIAVGRPGDVPFGVIADASIEIRTTSEDSISRALLLCLERSKLLVEPAGAVAMAAVLDDPTAFEPPVVVTASGGNIDPLLLMQVMRHGLAVAGRYLSLTISIHDRPGALATLLAEVGAAGANIIDVEHRRIDADLRFGDVEVLVHVETRGREHRDELVSHLRGSGYQVTVT